MVRFEKRYPRWQRPFAPACGLFGWFVVRRGLATLAAERAGLPNVTASRLDTRLPETSIPVELTGLVQTLNQMLERLQDAFNRLSNFSSDLAHELRTPVTNLTTQTQVALSQPRDAQTHIERRLPNAEEFERLSRMISDMLFLAKADHGLMLPSSETIELKQEIEGLLDFYDALAEERQVTLTVEGQGRITGDRLMLRRAISNLLSMHYDTHHRMVVSPFASKAQAHAPTSPLKTRVKLSLPRISPPLRSLFIAQTKPAPIPHRKAPAWALQLQKPLFQLTG